jgi:CBS domain-containing protein
MGKIMKVKDVMTEMVRTCTPETNLADAARSMWMGNCGVLPVVDHRGEVVGMITDRDICVATGCRRRDPAMILVSEVITNQAYACSADSDVVEALETMRQKNVRRLPVLDVAGKLCGVLSMDDVALKIQTDSEATEQERQKINAMLESIYAQRAKPRNAILTQPQRGQKVTA